MKQILIQIIAMKLAKISQIPHEVFLVMLIHKGHIFFNFF